GGGVRDENNSFEGPRENHPTAPINVPFPFGLKQVRRPEVRSMPDLEIMWTKVDEAPALATYSLLPIVEAFVGAAGVSVKLKDISLAGRIIATFPEKLTPAQRINDELT